MLRSVTYVMEWSLCYIVEFMLQIGVNVMDWCFCYLV